MALMKLSFVAKKAFEAYLMVSAVVVSVTMSGAPVRAKSSPTRWAAAGSSAPTTMRSGLRLSDTAEPSRRNSGFETTVMSGRPVMPSTSELVPTGTVDLLTTIAPRHKAVRISRATARTWLRSAEPSSSWGVGTQRNTNCASATASTALEVTRSAPLARPSRKSSSSPCSTMGESPAARRS